MTAMTTICGIAAMAASIVARAYGQIGLIPLLFIAALLIGAILDRMREERRAARSEAPREAPPASALEPRM